MPPYNPRDQRKAIAAAKAATKKKRKPSVSLDINGPHRGTGLKPKSSSKPTYSTKPGPGAKKKLAKTRANAAKLHAKSRKKESGGFGDGLARALKTVGGDVKQIGYGFADAAGDYGEAVGRDTFDLARHPARRQYQRTGHLLARDAKGYVKALDLAIPDPMNKEDRKAAADFWRKDPVIAASLLVPFTSRAARRASEGAIEGAVRRANPKLSKREASRVAKKESKLPGYAAAHGIKGGIKPRVLKGEHGEATARTQSRTPEGRAGQRAYDRASEAVEARFGPGAKFSTSQRAARMKERQFRKKRLHQEADIVREERIQAKGIGRFGRNKAYQSALQATLEAPAALSPREAVRVRIRDLVDVARRTDDPHKRDLLRAQIRDLRKSLAGDKLESPKFVAAVQSQVRISERGQKEFQAVTGASDETLAKRRDLVAKRYERKGLLPRQPATRVARTVEEAQARLDDLETRLNKGLDRVARAFQSDYLRTEGGKASTRQVSELDKGAFRKGQYRKRVRKDLQVQGDVVEGRTALPPEAKTAFEKARSDLVNTILDKGSKPGAHPVYKKLYDQITEIDELKTALAVEKEKGTFAEGVTTGGSLGTKEVPGKKFPTRARAFFPHRSQYESKGKGRVGGATLAATGRVVGIPQKGRAFAHGENKLALYEQGKLSADPKVLSNTLRGRLTFSGKRDARRYLYENAHEPVSGEDVPHGYYVVRNPDSKKAERIPDELKAAIENPERLLDVADEKTFHAWVDTWLYRPGSGVRPEWAGDFKNTRIIPEGVVRTVLADVFASAPHGIMASTIGALNAVARAVTIYTPYGGLRYIARNAPQNMVLLALTKPSAFQHIRESTIGLRRHDKELFERIKVEAGDIPARAGLPDLAGPQQTFSQTAERGLVAASRRTANVLGEVADEPFRVAAWIQYAKAYDFKTRQSWRELLASDDPNLVRVRDDIAQRVRDDLIDFDALTPAERESLSRFLFIYPFVRGAAKWPAMYVREYPVRAAVGALLAAQHARENPERKGSVLETGRTDIAGKEVDLGWLMPHIPAASTAETITNIAKAVPEGPEAIRAETSRLLSPQYREFLARDPSPYSTRSPWQGVARSFVPGLSTYQKLQQGGGPGEQALRFIGSSIEYTEKRKEKIAKLADEQATVVPKLRAAGYTPDEVAYVKKAYKVYDGIQKLRHDVSVDTEPGEPYYRKVLAAEADYLVQIGFYEPADARYIKSIAKRGTYHEVRAKRDWLVQNVYEKLYAYPTRQAAKATGYER